MKHKMNHDLIIDYSTINIKLIEYFKFVFNYKKLKSNMFINHTEKNEVYTVNYIDYLNIFFKRNILINKDVDKLIKSFLPCKRTIKCIPYSNFLIIYREPSIGLSWANKGRYINRKRLYTDETYIQLYNRLCEFYKKCNKYRGGGIIPVLCCALINPIDGSINNPFEITPPNDIFTCQNFKDFKIPIGQRFFYLNNLSNNLKMKSLNEGNDLTNETLFILQYYIKIWS